MQRLPVIVGFGGFNAAGRSSFHHAYRRTVLGSLDENKQITTLVCLASLMGLVKYENGQYRAASGELMDEASVARQYRSYIEQNTLIRRIGAEHFDADQVSGQRQVELNTQDSHSFIIKRNHLPQPVPENWMVETIDDKTLKVVIQGGLSVLMESKRKLEVQSAGTLPTGFDPAAQYNSRFHPRGLQLTVLGMSDALNSIGIPWDEIMTHVAPDQVATFAASALGQTDDYGLGGYLQARLKAQRASSKQMALSLNSMPADFVNAYVCGNLGTTGSMAGACASFLYNLRLGVEEISSGRHRIAICGSSEAPVTPEVIEGFAAMSALATDKNLAKLDAAEQPDYARASRPFADNCGFVIGESAQYFVLMDEELALQIGAQIHGAVSDVFVNADGFKKSISSPGAGNYLTLAKAVASARAIFGDKAIKHRSMVHAHGSSTPQNRVTESMIFDKVARAFEIENWPVSAVKAHLGHPLGPASGDQLSSALGIFADGIIPGIKTATRAADDVLDERLDICFADKKADIDLVFLNSKGFGGNNSTATVVSPGCVESMLTTRYGAQRIAQWKEKRNQVVARASAYDEAARQGDLQVAYKFGEGILDDMDVSITNDQLTINSFPVHIDLRPENPYADMV